MDLNHLSIPENRASNHQFSSPEGTSDSCSCAQVAGSEAQLHRLEAHLAKTEAELRLAKEREAHLVAEIRRLEAVCCPAGERALAEAEHLLQLKAEFVNNMHHELRTPLYGILGMATIGLRAEDPGRPGTPASAFSKPAGVCPNWWRTSSPFPTSTLAAVFSGRPLLRSESFWERLRGGRLQRQPPRGWPSNIGEAAARRATA